MKVLSYCLLGLAIASLGAGLAFGFLLLTGEENLPASIFSYMLTAMLAAFGLGGSVRRRANAL